MNNAAIVGDRLKAGNGSEKRLPAGSAGHGQPHAVKEYGRRGLRGVEVPEGIEPDGGQAIDL